MFTAAFLLGFLGSFHCIGMCGPIALALPLPADSWVAKVQGSLLYNIGRALTYSVLGLLFGLLGKGFSLFGWQQIISIAVGLLLIGSVVLPARYFAAFRRSSVGRVLPLERVKVAISNLFLQKSYFSLFRIGLLNGLLPCGLVYVGIAGAVASGTPLNGAVFMAVFGLGTLPAMLAMSLGGSMVSLKWRNKIRQALPMLTVLLGLLFIVRGMGLGIPYLSPAMGSDNTVHRCH